MLPLLSLLLARYHIVSLFRQLKSAKIMLLGNNCYYKQPISNYTFVHFGNCLCILQATLDNTGQAWKHWVQYKTAAWQQNPVGSMPPPEERNLQGWKIDLKHPRIPLLLLCGSEDFRPYSQWFLCVSLWNVNTYCSLHLWHLVKLIHTYTYLIHLLWEQNMVCCNELFIIW